MKIHKVMLALSALLILGVGGCKDELDINTDPNNAPDVSVDLLLPSGEAAVGFAVGNTLQIYGSIWAQYWTQNPSASQYRTLEQYNPSASDFNDLWANLNSDALEDFQRIIQKSRGIESRQQYQAIAMLMKAYTIQLSTDLFGDIPYTDAMQGDENVLNPRFDSQEMIYDSLVVLVDQATQLIDLEAENHPGADDLIYGGDMEQWLRFANTLKLKIGLRMSEVNPNKAQAVIQTLQGAEFIEPGESAVISYSTTGGNQNPLYSAIAGPVLNETQNLVGSSTAINFFNNHNDPRVAAFYQLASNDTYTGLSQGGYAGVPPGSPISIPTAALGADAEDLESATAPVKLMTDYEARFLEAEAVARGWLQGNAEALYMEGIVESLLAYGIDPENMTYPNTEESLPFEEFYAGVAYPTGAPLADRIKAIITQKWAAMTGNQGIESWIEWRRTGYPDFFTPSEASIIGQGRVPQIFLYPSDETTRNSNAPAQHRVFDRVWWDVQ